MHRVQKIFRLITVGEKAERVAAGWVIDDASRPQWAGQAVLRPDKSDVRRGWGLQEGGCSNDMHPRAADADGGTVVSLPRDERGKKVH